MTSSLRNDSPAGIIGCLTLVATLPWQSVVAGAVMFAIGLAGRAIVLASRSRRAQRAT